MYFSFKLWKRPSLFLLSYVFGFFNVHIQDLMQELGHWCLSTIYVKPLKGLLPFERSPTPLPEGMLHLPGS
jgi:hypothetical protein